MTRIKIDEFFTIDFELPENANPEQLSGLVRRLNAVVKMIGATPSSNSFVMKTPSQKTRASKFWTDEKVSELNFVMKTPSQKTRASKFWTDEKLPREIKTFQYG